MPNSYSIAPIPISPSGQSPLKQILEGFRRVSLEEIQGVALMNRVEFKFLTNRSTLLELLREARQFYDLLWIEGEGLMGYHSTYYDTPDFAFFKAHHRDRPVRHKVRYRHYQQTGSVFLEFKQRTRQDRTLKERVAATPQDLQTRKRFLQGRVEAEPLEAKLEVQYQRITLVSHTPPERLTLDLNLSFARPYDPQTKGFENTVIVELKTASTYQKALFPQLVRRFRLKGGGFSKYGVGCCELYPQLPHNRFKPQLMALRRIEYGYC